MEKYIFTDLDGTLFYPKAKRKMVPGKNKNFIDRFIADGGKVVLVSGRGPMFVDKVCYYLGHQVDYICCNGASIYQDGHPIKEDVFDTSFLKDMIDYVSDNYKVKSVILFTKHRNMVFPKDGLATWVKLFYPIYMGFQGSYREVMTMDDQAYREELEKGEVEKAMIFFGATPLAANKAKAANKELREKFEGKAEFSWTVQCIEVTPVNCSKSNGIRFYLDYNHINSDNVLVVGDSGNDISMFEAFKEESYCMAHAHDSVKKHATHIIKRFYSLEDYVYPSEETIKTPEITDSKEGN
ncbi:MAG: Cof-type HAD-IIB family hydrolase [Bacilli bacterium]|nr:Cof-type HAD-IIB family hydrolase [Bacilli bacterium]